MSHTRQKLQVSDDKLEKYLKKASGILALIGGVNKVNMAAYTTYPVVIQCHTAIHDPVVIQCHTAHMV